MPKETEKHKRIEAPEYKKKIVDEFKEMISSNRTTLIASCRGLPGKQFHEIKKKLRGIAEIKFAKKNMINRAIDQIDKGALKNIKTELKSDFVVLFSDVDPFELASLLIENQSPARAKAGDVSPEDLEVEPRLTELPAGPAISELSGVGLKVKVTDGKLEIIKGAIIAKKDEEIRENVASVLSKLGINPMKVGFLPLAAYDSKDDKIYTEIVIDKKGTLEELRNLLGKALGFAVKVEYITDKTISYFISKAASHERALSNLVEENKNSAKELDSVEGSENVQDSKESSLENSEDKSHENESDSTKQDIKEEA